MMSVDSREVHLASPTELDDFDRQLRSPDDQTSSRSPSRRRLEAVAVETLALSGGDLVWRRTRVLPGGVRT